MTMVFTRKRYPDGELVSQVNASNTAARDLAAQLEAAIAAPSINLSPITEKPSDTMGSRLRKRPRTSSPNGEASTPSKKRQNRQTPAASDAPRGRTLGPPPPFQMSPQAVDHDPALLGIVGCEALANDTRLQHVSHGGAVSESSATLPPPPPFQTGIEELVSRAQQGELEYASQGYDEIGTVDMSNLLPSGAALYMKIQCMPILDNLATQILNILAKSNYQGIVDMAINRETDPGKTYESMKELFTYTKKIYSSQAPFLVAHELGLVENAQLDTIRKANMATFVTSVFGSQDVGFYHLNEYFLDVFVPDGCKLLMPHAQLLLDLKTQAYISAISNKDRTREDILDDLFPSDLGERLLKRRPAVKHLTPSEDDFVRRARYRRKALLDEPATEEALAALPEKYVWEDFLRYVSAYISRNFDSIAGEVPRKTSRSQRAANTLEARQKQRQLSQETLEDQQNGQELGQNQQEHSGHMVLNGDDIAGKAHRAAQFAMQDYGIDGGSSESTPQPVREKAPANSEGSSVPPRQQQQYEFRFENELHPNVPSPPVPYFQHIPYQHPQMQNQWHPSSSGLHPSYSQQHLIPYPTQSAPTQVLYERARMAATSKVSPNFRRPGSTVSQRRPWTTDEENSLMAGLDRVKGPHWSQILAMFGPGGTINEALKDRNQVQLKDKARNLKLFFLKSSIEVPYYLQFVTGELKTRAPAQAAKNEAKGKRMSEDDRAHIQGIMALAGGSAQDGEQSLSGIQGANGIQNGHMASPPNLDGNPNNVDPELNAIQIHPLNTNHLTSSASINGQAPPEAGNMAPSADMISSNGAVDSATERHFQMPSPSHGHPRVAA